jgi:2-aminoethylphosphonate dioxygenase
MTMSETSNPTSGLTREQKQTYQSDGFVTVGGLLTPAELSELQTEADRLWDQRALFEAGNLRACARGTVDGGQMFDRLDPINDLSPVFSRFSADARLKALARSAIGEDVRLLKDKIIYKPPGVLGYDLHQDLPYIPLELPFDAIAIVMISIDAADAESGPIEFFPAMHHGIMPGEAAEPRNVDIAAIDPDSGQLGLTDAGDIIMFHSLTPHRSAANVSSNRRAFLYFTYVAARCGDLTQEYYDRRFAELRELAAREKAAEPFFR